jgi:serine/threonine protein kinase/tetratricopeptide (TPR) repeat protein
VNAAFGRYRLLERLGQGGMAEVFKAKSYGVEGFEKVLVIKRILPELARSHEFVEMFIHEAKLAVRLSHANIVQVFDLGKAPAPDPSALARVPSGGLPGVRASRGGAPSTAPAPSDGPVGEDAYYIAMEYVHGLDLASVLGRTRRQQVAIPVQFGVYVASEVAKGLDHAHRRRDEQMRSLGIVHRDVSPQNVLLSFEGEVKVTDFGIAKARGALERSPPEDTRTRRLHGKFGYMSPEQAHGENVDARSDLFSLGTILYECVAGVNPFSAPTTYETLRRVQACEYPPVELLRPDVPPELVNILKTAMAKAPGDRFADAGRMYEALLAFLYAQGSRFGSHDLAEFLARFRDAVDASPGLPPAPMLEADHGGAAEHTPVLVPAARGSSSVRVAESYPERDSRKMPTGRPDAGPVERGDRPRLAAVDRAIELGERREVTALVLELPRDAPEALVERAATIIGGWGGRVLRREAGHIAALFGLGDPDGRDTEMATRCALVALRSLEASPPPSAGLHTGRIHVAPAGEPTEDDRVGSLFDTARELARVREGRAAMSAQAMLSVRSFFELESTSDGSRSAFESAPFGRAALRASEAAAAVLVKDVRGPRETFGRFVGRKDELRRIGEVLAQATKRTARVLTIRGDHGIGKTRLLFEVERRLRKGGYNVGFHVATCLPRGNEFPLSGMVGMLHVLCGTTEGEARDRILAVVPRLRALGLQGDELYAVLIALGAPVPHITGNARALLRQAFARMVQSLCEDRPHAFAWDAAHAMDDESFALLGETLSRLAQVRVVLVFAARAGFSHALERGTEHVAMELDDLMPPDVERLVALRLRVDAVPDELLQFVRARAGGHPLFVEEVIKALVDAGAVTVSDWRVASMKLVGQELALPKTLRGLVASRVARLSRDDRATLQAAAILGDPIELTVLSNMTGRAMPALERSIATLKERELVVETGPSEMRFASPLIPEIVADALTPEAAREMNAAAGQALEATLGERASEHAARIAGHLYEAGDRERAAGYFAKSGERRLDARQLDAAARDFARAIALADPTQRAPEEMTAWLEHLGSALRLVGSTPDAVELCARVVGRADAAEAPDVRVRARVAAGQLLSAAQCMDEARARLAEAEAIAGEDEALVKRVLMAETELATRQGDFKRALEKLDELQWIVRSETDSKEKHRVALQLAQAHGGLGDRRTALASLREAEQLVPDDRMAVLERTKVRSLVNYLTGDYRSAALESEKAIDLGREMGLAREVMLNLHNLGDILVHLEDLPRAYGAIRQSLALSEESGFERLANYNRMLLAFLDGIQGTVDGERLLRQGIAYAESKNFTWDVIGGRALLAKLLYRGGQLDAARAEYETTRALAAAAGHRLVVDDAEHALRKLASVGREARSPTAS